jgi:hypothetical protein
LFFKDRKINKKQVNPRTSEEMDGKLPRIASFVNT